MVLRLPNLKGFFLDFLSAVSSQDSQKSLLQSEVVGTQAGLTVTPPSTLLKNGKSDPEDRKGTHFVQKQTMPS